MARAVDCDAVGGGVVVVVARVRGIRVICRRCCVFVGAGAVIVIVIVIVVVVVIVIVIIVIIIIVVVVVACICCPGAARHQIVCLLLELDRRPHELSRSVRRHFCKF